MPPIQGIIVATLTPYGADGAPNLGQVREHVAYLAEAGIPAIAPVGTTGEFPFLALKEKCDLLRAACSAAGSRLAVIAGVWAERLEDVVGVRLAEEAQRDVPVLGLHEAHAPLVLAPQRGQLLDDVGRRPDGDEQPRHQPGVHSPANAA